MAGNTVANNGAPGMLAVNGGDDAGANVTDNTVCGNRGGQMQLKSARQSNNRVMETCPSDLNLTPAGGATPGLASSLPPAPRNFRVLSLP